MNRPAGGGRRGSDTEIARVVIVGGGTAGWMAAAAFSRFLNNGRREIVLVESDAIGTVGVGEATIPPLITYNRMLGINENVFLKATRGTFKLGIEFVDWGRVGDRYFHPFGSYGHDINGISFHQLWLREVARGGDPGSLDEFCVSALAARLGRFGRPSPGAQSALSSLFYAFHFDASLYARFLRNLAERQGAVRREGKVVKVHRDGESGDVTAVELEGAEVIDGDLFIDCSGFRALLIGEQPGAEWDDWSHWLPCDRAIAIPSALTGPAEPYTRSTARAAGWQWRIPLQHRMGNGQVFSSRFMEEDEARRILLANLGGEALAEPRTIRFVAGRRTNSWSGNVVALGLSSGFIEPLESTSIHLIQNGIQRLLALFPGKPISPAEREEYNHGMGELYDDVRDFIILHYKMTQRGDTPFWRYVRDMEIPEGLARKIELWRLHGRVFRENAELFGTASWVAVMLGQNLWPEIYEPLADSLDEAKVAQAMAAMRADYRKVVEALPTQEQFLRAAGAWSGEEVAA